VGSLIGFVFSPGGVVLCLLAAAGWSLRASSSRGLRLFLFTAAFGYWLASADYVARGAGQLLASGYKPLARGDVPAGSSAVVLLGSGAYQVGDWSHDHYTVVDRIGAERLLEAWRVFRLVDASYIVSSGGLMTVTDFVRPSGQVMAEALQRLGVPRDRLIVETESRTTREEAVVVGGLLARHPVDHVVLVTTASHMRRSQGTFKAVGIDVIPAIAYEGTPLDTWWKKALPSDRGLGESALVAHEIAGIPGYLVRGWFKF
jgi:uncharacterized SAM-binding protein YcdF (DUF218 family)